MAQIHAHSTAIEAVFATVRAAMKEEPEMNPWLHFVAACVLLCAAWEPLAAGEPQA